MTRTFHHEQAKRERVPLLVGLYGPSGCGKTYSALRLATGMQRKTGGDIFVIDTEARRALHYADEFDFQHVPLEAPFNPESYADAIKYCMAQGAGVIVVDSASHEHEGEGGVLDMHDSELDRMCGTDFKKRDRMTWTAWKKPKQEHRRLVDTILRFGVNAVFCFRAKEKIKIVKGKEPLPLGWQPIIGPDFAYEMTVNLGLQPAAKGVPTIVPEERGEINMLKLPEKLSAVFPPGKALDEEAGEKLAQWAAGDVSEREELEQILSEVEKAASGDDLDAIRDRWASQQRETGLRWSAAEKKSIGEAVARRMAVIEGDEPGLELDGGEA